MKKKVKRRLYEEAGSTATLVGAGIFGSYLLLDPAILKSLRESMKHARHGVKTVEEMVKGTRGQRAVEGLAEKNETERSEYLQQMSYLDEMRFTYRENETLSREKDRLLLHINGATMHLTEGGDKLVNKSTGGIFGKIDDFFIDIAGKVNGVDSRGVRETIPKITRVYEKFREFYDKREKGEITTEEFCKYLEREGLRATEENSRIREDLANLARKVGETYEVEDSVFNIDDRVNGLKQLLNLRIDELPSSSDIRELEIGVKGYGESIDSLRTSIEKNTGIAPYRDPSAWIDYGLNPLTVGIAGGLVAKGITSILPGRRYIRKTLASPYGLAYRGVKRLAYTCLTAGKDLGKRGIEAGKNFWRKHKGDSKGEIEKPKNEQN